MKKINKNDGVKVILKVTPKASVNKIFKLDSISDEIWAFKVMVTAVPEQGKANAAVINLLAKELGFAKSQISLVQGETARMKTILISGNKEEIMKILSEYTGKS